MKGKILGVKYEGEWYLCERNAELNMDKELYPTASKDKGFWNDYIGGQKGWSITMDGAVNPMSAYSASFNNIIKRFINTDTKVQVEFSTKTTESMLRYYGQAMIKSINVSAPVQGEASVNFMFQGCGKLNYEEIDLDYIINSMPIIDDKPFIVSM